MKSFSVLFFILATHVSPLMAQAAKEDAVSEGLREAYRLQQAGKSDKLLAKLREIIRLVEEDRTKRLASRLPDRLGDWEGEPVKNEDLAFLGGGNTISRAYTQGERRITIRVVKDSPLAKGIGALVSNEALVAASGRKTERISGMTAVFEGERKLQMVPAPDLFLEIQGNEKTRPSDLVTLARRLDLRAIANFAKAVPVDDAE